MTGVMAGCSLTAFSIFHLGRKIIVRPPTPGAVEKEDVEMVKGL
jgi:hypothetical protein